MKRFAGSLVLLLVVALPALARVVSYAPYTNRVARPSFQDRTARHFVLIEVDPSKYWWNASNDIVLYDSSGLEEPRVITPEGPAHWRQAALFQKDGSRPVVLALAYGRLLISEVRDAGQEWKTISGPAAVSEVDTLDVDTGGPFSNGLFGAITIGNEEWPFIVTLRSAGVWAIRRTGEARHIFNPGARVIGRDATGTRFLISTGTAIWSTDVDGGAARLGDAPWGYHAGWLRADGRAYVEVLTVQGRYLFLTNPGSMTMQFVAGAYGASAAASGGPPSSVRPLHFFAVPTHDFQGAWMIQRNVGAPTTLLRHTPAAGLQTMWADVSGPQVEALIAGRSGETVLVQVHREREGVDLSRPFIDPALAVWRVGQPAPKVYDELYLNEEWNKGFVRIDVDRIESGETFVFNSGYKEVEPQPSRVSAPIGGGGDVVQEWGVVRGSLKQRLVLPGVARLRGAYESFWTTDVTLYNPLSEKQDVEIRFVVLGSEDSRTAGVTLEPQEIRRVADVLNTLFAIDSGGGTLHLLPAVGINATARTYSRKGEGTYGFSMQAVDFLNSIGPRFAVSFAGAFPGEHFRTNVLITDTSGRGAHVTLKGNDAFRSGSTAGAGVDTPRDGSVQVNATRSAIGLHARAAVLLAEPARGTAISTVVAIDNRTNDPTWFPPDLPGTIPRAIPVIGHVDGANGAKFRSDLYIYNPSGTYRTLELWARKWDAPTRIPARLFLGPWESLVVPDAMRALFNAVGFAHVRYGSAQWETGEAIRVTSRTYAVNAEGGTYGCLVPPLNGFQIGAFGDRLEILGVSGGPGFRTNVGLVDLSETTQRNPTVRIRVVDEKHRTLDVMTVQVPARGGMQINDIFGARGITPPSAALLVIEVVDGQQIAAYATLTDNVTNDSSYLASYLGAQPEN
jgi:hypothetical protein